MSSSDTDLTAWVVHGDRVALERAVADLMPLGTLVARRLLDPPAAEDAVQSSIIRMLSALPRWRSRGAGARAWFAAIVANECRRHMRQEVRLRNRHRRMPAATAAESEPDLEALRQALTELPDHEQSAVTMHHLAGQPIVEVARALGCSERTARTWIQSGCMRMRRRLGAAVILLLTGAAAQGAEPTPATVAAVRQAVAVARSPRTRVPAWTAATLAGFAGIAAIAWWLMASRPLASAAPGPAVAAAPVTPLATPTPDPTRPDTTRRLEGASNDGGPLVNWVGERPAGADRRLVVFGHPGTDQAEAWGQARLLGSAALTRGWAVVVAWRPEDPDGSHLRPTDVVRLLAALDREEAVPLYRTVLAGISAGGDSALTAGLAGLVPAAAVVGWPGRPPPRIGWRAPTLIVGLADDALGWAPDLKAIEKGLRGVGVAVELHLVPGDGHVPGGKAMDLAGWLDRVVPAGARPGMTAAEARRLIAAAGPDAALAAAIQVLGPEANPADLVLLADRLGRAVNDGARLALVGAIQGLLLRADRRQPPGIDLEDGLRLAQAGDSAGFVAWISRWQAAAR